MSAWLLYGQRSDGELLHISEAARGEACNCFCPHCQMPLAAKKGNVKIHHFAHLGKTCAFTSAYDFFHVESFVDTSRSLADWAIWKQQDLEATASRLSEELPQMEQQMAQLLSKLVPARQRLELISQPHSSRKQRSQKRQANYEVLQQWDRWIEDHNADELDLERVRDLESCEYVLLNYRQLFGRQEYGYSIGRSVWPNEMWWEDNKDEDWIPYWLAKAAIHLLNEYPVLRRKLISTRQQKEAFELEKARFEQFRLYFLLIEFDQRPALFKIGITSRANLTERITELKTDLRKAGVHTITSLIEVPGRAYLENYFKKKYADRQVKLGTLTEYFSFDDNQVDQILQELTSLIPRSSSLSDRIKQGMNRARQLGLQLGRPTGSESETRFLTKPKSQRVIELIRQYPDWSMRDIASYSGIALNTVCKVNNLYRNQARGST